MNKERVAKVRKNYRLSSETIEQMQVLIQKLNDSAEFANEFTKMAVKDFWNETSLIEYLIWKEFHQYENQVSKSSEEVSKSSEEVSNWLPECDKCGLQSAEVFLVESGNKEYHICENCLND